MIQLRTLAILLVGVLGAAGCIGVNTPPGTFSPVSGGTASNDILGTIEVTAADLSFDPANVTVDKAGKYEVKLTNKGAITHDITFADGSAASADAGQSASVVVIVPAAGPPSSALSQDTPTPA